MHPVSAVVLLVGGLVLLAGGERIRRGGRFAYSEELRPMYYRTAFVGGVGLLAWGAIALVLRLA